MDIEVQLDKLEKRLRSNEKLNGTLVSILFSIYLSKISLLVWDLKIILLSF
jgi:hypothetical protein